MTEEQKQYREEAAEWVNGKRKSYEAGVALMEKIGYKPNVLSYIKKWGDGVRAIRALNMELRNYLRFVVNPDNPIHKDSDIYSGEKKTINPEDQNVQILGNIEKELANEEYPGIIKQLLTEFSELYKGRSIFHKELKDVGEDNDDVSTGKRSRLIFIIDATSRRMDLLWPAFEAYKKDSILPDESLFVEPFDPEKDFEPSKIPTPEKVEFAIADNLVELKKQKENLRIKLTKRNNQLLYQSETKGKKDNPMPESPKRAKIEKEILDLQKNKEAVEFKIVELS